MQLKDLNPGDKILFGRYNGKPIKWIVGDQNHYKTNTTPLITEYILDWKVFDNKEPNNPNSDIRNDGNNNYQYSNIDQWLNSNKLNWYNPIHEYDNAPDYINEPGFLYKIFTNEEKKMIEEVPVKIVSTLFNRKVFLLSLWEYGINDSYSVYGEGKQWSLFSDNSSRICRSEVDNISYGYWTRTPRNTYVNQSGYIKNAGYDSYMYSSNIAAIRPALNLNSFIEINSKPNSDGYYELKRKKYILFNRK